MKSHVRNTGYEQIQTKWTVFTQHLKLCRLILKHWKCPVHIQKVFFPPFTKMSELTTFSNRRYWKQFSQFCSLFFLQDVNFCLKYSNTWMTYSRPFMQSRKMTQSRRFLYDEFPMWRSSLSMIWRVMSSCGATLRSNMAAWISHSVWKQMKSISNNRTR